MFGLSDDMTAFLVIAAAFAACVAVATFIVRWNNPPLPRFDIESIFPPGMSEERKNHIRKRLDERLGVAPCDLGGGMLRS